MARIPQSEIERLKTEVDLATIVKAKGIELKKHGAQDLVGRCPFHDDKTPSLVISPKKNLWHCLGGCQTGGDVIQWVMKAESVSFRHAVELLRDGLPGANTDRKHTTTRRLETPVDFSAQDHVLMRQVVDYYHSALKANAAAIAYLQERGINSGEAIERFKIGLADRTLGLRLPAKQIKAGKDIRERLKKLGIIRDSGHEHFNGSIVFPIFDAQQRVVEMYGRKITKGLRKGTALHLYLPGPHAGVWNMETANATEDIILCESIIDALTFWCAGYRNVTASYGIEGFNCDEYIEAFRRCGKKRVLIAYDRDKGGDSGAQKRAAELTEAGFDCYRVEFPAGMDANEYALKVTPAAQSLGLVLRKAKWMGQGKAPKDGPQITQEAIAPIINVVAKKAAKEETPRDEPTEKPRKDEGTIDTTPVPSLAASPQPPAPTEIVAEIRENEIVIEVGNRAYRIRGLEKNLAIDVLKVNVLARKGEAFYVDTFDLYAARARNVFVKEAARDLGVEETVIKRDIGKVLLKLEGLQDEQISEQLKVKEDKVELTDTDKQAALELLRSPNLVDRILKDFDRCGVVGEETNKLVGYLAATSRKLEKPLAVVIQSSSAAGKSSLMDAVLRFVPTEEQVGYSAMTGQSLFYMGGMQLKHKILSIAEEEGVAQASYALKLLQSEGALTIASTGKDPGTGRMETQEYHVEGPVMIFLTTTAIDIDEELLNRCVVLTVDENRDQTRAIHEQQRKNETLAGLLAGQQSHSVRKLHQDAQRLLRPLLVVNPFADRLAFIADRARRRRDHMKYLTLIRSIALLHQYQRELQTVEIDGETIQYIEVTLQDIVLANRLADQVLGKSIDELPPQTRRLLRELFELVQKECKAQKIEQCEYRFTRRLLRERLGWGQTQLRLHLDRLVEMEYVVVHGGGRGKTTVYELLYDGRGREGQPTLCGLIDVAKLTNTTNNLAGQNGKLAGSNRGQSAPLAQPSTNGKPKPVKT